MDGIVLAAGSGTRLRPLTADTPKGLVRVAGRPLLSHVFDTALSVGVERLTVVVGYRAGDIIDHYGDGYRGVPVEYVHQDEQLGTGHALRRAFPLGGTTVVLNGDNVCRADLDRVVDRHRATDAAATLLVESVTRERARETGVVVTDDGRVTGLVEKPDDPPSTLVVRGFQVVEPTVEPACRLLTPSDRGEYELTDAVDLLVKAGHRVETVELDGWCHNVNDTADIERVTERLG
ncbi:nucleotidyltransferase family protein [Halomicroarcula sp. GCM10025709]|uniref:nucleotidyltransferase family protein n=1 Tax=Haloarcula TaxID=2237 RepID=UPI0024C38985|nr:nucleotidyltransferase family protein [Halomicroarcula sp. YJ-61-S]